MLFFSLLILIGFQLFKKYRREYYPYLFFCLWFFAGLLLHSQIFPLDATVADRWMYFPYVGLLGAIGVGLDLWLPMLKKLKTYVYVAGVIILILMSLRTVVRNVNWIDALTLYTHDSKIHTNYNIENNLGFEYSSVGNYKEAITHYIASADMYPYDATIANLAQIYDKLGDKKLAKKYYIEAIESKYTSSNTRKLILSIAYERLGYISLLMDQPVETIKFVKKTLNLYPNSANLWSYLAISEYKLQNKSEALAAALKAKSLQPNEQTTYLYNQILNNQPIQIK